MKFTDRFIEISVTLYDKTQGEMIGYNNGSKECESVCKINPFEISHYREAMDDNDELNTCCIYFKNGDSMIANCTLKEFEELLNKHQQ